MPVLVFACTWCIARAPHYDNEQRKQVDKTYTITSGTSVSFTNSFGELHVNTWDKNQMQVHIDIITRSSTEDRAKDLLDRININIEDANPSSSITYKTVINSSRNNNGNNSMEINYTVYMPKNNPLYLKNSFGDCYLADYDGKVTINESYGNLNTGKLTNNNDVDLSFGGGTSKIDAFNTGDLKVSYSSLNVGTIGQADVNSQFSNLDIDQLADVTMVSKYGKVNLGEVGSLEATVNFSSFDVDRLNKRLKLDIQYGGQTNIGNISKDIQSIDINSSFGPVRLDLPPDLNAGITVKVQFGNFSYDHGSVDFNKIHEGNTSREYEGRIGKGSSAVTISVTSQYGDVRIRQD